MMGWMSVRYIIIYDDSDFDQYANEFNEIVTGLPKDSEELNEIFDRINWTIIEREIIQ